MKTVILDFGNVIGFFDHHKASRQLAGLAIPPVPEDRVFRAVFGTSLESDFDSGKISAGEFVDRLRALLGLTAPDDSIVEAWCDIFSPNDELTSLLPRLKQSAERLVLASNTNDLHFEWIRKRFAEQLAHFDGLVLSYRIGVRKPERAFFAECLATAGALPGDCVFVDDRQDFVDAARDIGMAAVLYRAGSDVEHALRATGLGMP